MKLCVLEFIKYSEVQCNFIVPSLFNSDVCFSNNSFSNNERITNVVWQDIQNSEKVSNEGSVEIKCNKFHNIITQNLTKKSDDYEKV